MTQNNVSPGQPGSQDFDREGQRLAILARKLHQGQLTDAEIHDLEQAPGLQILRAEANTPGR